MRVDRTGKLYQLVFGATVSTLNGVDHVTETIGGGVEIAAETVATIGVALYDGVKHKISEVPAPRVGTYIAAQ